VQTSRDGKDDDGEKRNAEDDDHDHGSAADEL